MENKQVNQQEEEYYYDDEGEDQDQYNEEEQDQYYENEEDQQYEQEQYEQEQYEQQLQQQQKEQKRPSKQENKKLPGLMDQDPELEEQRRNLWKEFGRETGAGKALFGLYKSHQAPKINYPKVKTKVREPVVKEKKKCPQKTQIEYPEVNKRPKYKFHQIDFVMRRKPEWEIKKEIDEYFSKKYIPLNRGKNRQNMVNDLQKKFKDQRGALPKGAELPKVGYAEQVEVTEKMKAQAIKRTNKKYKNFSNNQEDDVSDAMSNWTGVTMDPIDEMNEMFDAIMKEIEERQKFLDSIDNLQDKKLKEQIKQEIVERVSELQKVSELKKYYQNKQNQQPQR